MGKTEVTVGQFRRFVVAEGYKTEAERGDWCNALNWTGEMENSLNYNWRNPGFKQEDSHPVVCVSWNDAQAYIEWINKITVGKHYRLPTEAEWEYAARANSTTAYWWGSEPSHEYANYGNDECCAPMVNRRDQWEFTAPAGSFSANAFGLHDVLGNVWEWTCSVGDNNQVGTEQKCISNKDASALYVLRGGSWYSTSANMRSASRARNNPSERGVDIGFRLVQDY
ncbi:putative Formylglycine-generating enzyme [Gammaproteobacteria bacterium]